MDKLICSSCGAAILPVTTQAFLTCEYCDTAISNPYYNESAAKAAAEPTLQEQCVKTLLEMGESENLQAVNDNCFGNPLRQITSARNAMDIPDDEQVYFLLDHLSILGNVKEALALGDHGLYYRCDGKTGSRSWEAFITGAIACNDRTGWTDSGTLTIGSSLTFSITGDDDSRLAGFLIDFHNRMYVLHTGQNAPAEWCVSEGSTSSMLDTATMIGTASTLARTLLQRNIPQRSIVQRPVTLRTNRKPAVHKQDMHRPAPPRPSHPMSSHPQRPAMPGRPGPSGRMGGPGGRGGRGGMGGMGGPDGHGGRGGMGGPGGRR